MIRKIGNVLFKYRSYTPLPFLFVMILFASPTGYSILAGLVIALLGESIRLWSVSYAGSATRTTQEVGGDILVTQGPYSLVRNPLYVGNVLIYMGIGVMSNALFPYLPLFAFAYFTFQYYCIILSEEDYLRKNFGDIYNQYTVSVNRFFPRRRPLPKEISSNLPLDIKDGLRSERRSIQALVISSLIILAFYFSGFRILGK